MIIRICRACGRKYDAFPSDTDQLCQLCAGELENCESISDDAVYLKDVREKCEEPEPNNPVLERSLKHESKTHDAKTARSSSAKCYRTPFEALLDGPKKQTNGAANQVLNSGLGAEANISGLDGAFERDVCDDWEKELLNEIRHIQEKGATQSADAADFDKLDLNINKRYIHLEDKSRR